MIYDPVDQICISEWRVSVIRDGSPLYHILAGALYDRTGVTLLWQAFSHS